MLKEAVLLLGVDEKAILLQKEPINTCQEAREYANRFGIDVIPSATNYRLKGSWKKRLGLPSANNMSLMSSAVNSNIAMAEAKLRNNLLGSCS